MDISKRIDAFEVTVTAVGEGLEARDGAKPYVTSQITRQELEAIDRSDAILILGKNALAGVLMIDGAADALSAKVN